MVATMDRKAVSSNVKLCGNSYVPQGNVVVVAQASVMRDPANFVNPDKFDPTRFLSTEKSTVKSTSRFTHPSNDFLYWGGASRPW